MAIDRILIHGCFPNFSGYAAHTRNFATALNKLMPVRVRNFAHQKNLSHLTQEQKDMVILQQNGDMILGKPYDGDVMGDYHTLNIILLEHNHFWFYQDYHGPTIGYCVWESTRMKNSFFDRLLQLDGMFVPTEWQRNCMIEQGYPENRIWVVPEGIDGIVFKPGRRHQGKFRFLVFGRWDYRKAITENIKAFLDADLDAELILSADNPFPVDGYKSTEERLEKYELEDPRIKIIHFPPDDEYIKYLQGGNVFLGISRAEGWNLPAIEAIACGTPAIMSKHGGQLDYSKDTAHFVNTKEEQPVEHVFNTSKEDMSQLGNWVEPDWEHAVEAIKDVYDNYKEYKKEALEYSKVIRDKFSWENAAEKAYNIIGNLKVTKPKSTKKKVEVKFEFVTDYKHPKVDFTPIEGFNNENYICSMRDLNTNFALFHDRCELKNGFGRWMQYPACKRNLSGVVFEIAEPNGNIVFRKELNLGNNLDLTVKGKKCKLETLQLEAIWGCYNEIFHTENYSYKDCCIEEGDVVLDLGANYGLFSLYAVDKGAAKIYAFEPVSEVYNFLKVNTEEFKNIKIYRKAVDGITGKKDIKIFDGDSTSNSLVCDKKCDKLETVYVIGINELLKEIGHIDFIKCDIEGSEYNVFRAIDDELLKGIKKIILEYHYNYNDELNIILKKLKECGFEYTTRETNSKAKYGYVIAFKEVGGITTKKSKKDGRLNNNQETSKSIGKMEIYQDLPSLSFLKYTEDGLGILFKSNINSKLNVVSYVIDEYTGLTSYRMKMVLKPGINYFLKGAKNIKHVNFVIYDEFEKVVLLKVEKSYGNIDMEDCDKLGKLKNYKIVDNKQSAIALPLYEIFVDKIQEKEASCRIHNGDTVFDIGGSIGLFSYYAVGKKAKEVHYFEPLKDSYDSALQNLKNFDNIKFNNVAVGKTENNVDFFVPETGSIGSSMYLEEGKKLKVDSINIMDYIVENNIEKIDFLKLDCEGSEYDIFDSMPDNYLINNVKKIFMEFHFNKNNILREKILNKLDRCGFIYKFEAGKNENNELGILYAWKFSAKEFDFDFFIKPYENDLKRTGESRYNFYRYVIPKLIAKQKPLYVIETGMMWVDLKDNMGAFTLIFSDLIKNWSGGKLVTIDISKEHMDNCKELTKEFSDVIEYINSDSITYLKSLSNNEVKKIDLFYFDSFDLNLTDPEPSQQHHLNELLSVYNRISDNVIISVDDNFLPGCWVEWEWYDSNGNIMSTEIVGTGNKIIGKGTLINEFLLEKGWERKTDIEIFPGSNVFLYKKPHKKSYSEVKEVLENFYFDKMTQKIKREPFQNIDVLVSEIRLGDTVIATPFSKDLCIHSNSEYFSTLMTFNDYYKTCDSFDNSCSTPEISKNDWGGGHVIQRIERALGLKVSIKPKGDLNIEKKIVKNKVAIHLNRSGAKHTDLSQKSKNLVNKFMEKYSGIYEFVKIDPKNTLTKTIEMLSTCEYFIGLNSGPMHLATALDLKCVVLVNSPLSSELFLPKMKECEIPELEWLYPQNVHLHENGSNELVPKLTIRSLKNAFEGKVYPYWKEDFLDIGIINEVVQEPEDKEIKIICHFVGRDNVGGPFVEIKGGSKEKDYLVKFIDNTADEVIYQDTIKSNHWTAASRKYYTNWNVEVSNGKEIVYKHKMNLKNKRVLINLDSKSLGDTLCWVPYVEEFRKKHNCEIFCRTFWNNIIDYPDINFIEPGAPYTDIHASYTVGCFDGDTNRNKNHWQTIPLQQISSDYLGLEYKEIRPKLKKFTGRTDMKIKLPKKYVVIAPHSTAQMKYFLNDRWNKIINYLHKIGYETISLSKEPSELANTIYVTNPSIEDAIRIVKRSKFTMTVGNGIAWLSFALKKPNILISGFSNYCEFNEGCYRITPNVGCRGCFNRPEIPFVRDKWNYCWNADVNDGERFECAENISVKEVIRTINKLIKENF